MSSPSDAAATPTAPSPTSGPSSNRPPWWPHFSSTLRSTALTARLGRALGIAFGLCFLTGLLSYYQYDPWLGPVPAVPEWGYRVTQGIHVTTGFAAIPLLLLKLWSVYPNKFRFPPLRDWRHALLRVSTAILVSSALLQVLTGLLNVLDWRPFPWDFLTVHYYLAWVVIGSVLLHVAVKLPDIAYGLRTKPVADGDVLTEVPWYDNPASHSNAGDLPAPVTPGISRRGLLNAGAAGIGIVVVTSVGQTLTPLAPVGLLAVRQPARGPQGVPVSRTASEAGVLGVADSPDWALEVVGPRPFRLTLAELEGLPRQQVRLPIAAGEGWSAMAEWGGISLLELAERAGGTAASQVRVSSLAKTGAFRTATVAGAQLPVALLATHLNGQRLSLDHGYPLRLVTPNRPETLDTKWVGRIEVR